MLVKALINYLQAIVIWFSKATKTHNFNMYLAEVNIQHFH